MGGSYTAGETGCVGGCERLFKDGDKVIVVNQATYNERDEVLDFEPYTESLYCPECWENKEKGGQEHGRG